MLSQKNHYLLLVCFALTGCKKKHKIGPLPSKAVTVYQEILARHSEIPDVMLGFVVDQVVCDESNDQAIEILYKPKLGLVATPLQIKQSYVADMELLGWKQVAEFMVGNMQLLFERPKSKILCNVQIFSDCTVKVTVLHDVLSS